MFVSVNCSFQMLHTQDSFILTQHTFMCFFSCSHGETFSEERGCNNNNLLISKISSTCFGQSFTHHQERKTEIFTAYGIVSCCCGRQGFGERQRGT